MLADEHVKKSRAVLAGFVEGNAVATSLRKMFHAHESVISSAP